MIKHIAFLIMLCANVAYAQEYAAVGPPMIVHHHPQNSDPTTGLMPVANDDYANWSNVGLISIGGIPARPTQCGATVTPSGITPPASGDDASKIQAAVNSCTPGDYVGLACSTFHYDQTETLQIESGITVRGCSCPNSVSPYCQTVLTMDNGALGWYGTATCGVNSSSLVTCHNGSFVYMGASPNNNNWWSGCTFYHPPNATCATHLSSDGTQGSNTISVVSTTGFSVGMWILIDEATGANWVTDPMDATALSPSLGQIWAASDWLSSNPSPATGRVAYMAHNPYITYVDDYNIPGGSYPYIAATGPPACNWGYCDRLTQEIHQITAIGSGPCPCTITLNSPLTINFRVNGGTSFTGSVSNGSTTLTVNSGTVLTGCIVQGPGIPNNDYVASGSGTSFTLSEAATANETSQPMYNCSHAAEIYYPSDDNGNYLAFVSEAGLENVSVLRSSGAGISMQFCAYCWTKNVEVGGWTNDGVALTYDARPQIDTSYIWGAYNSCNEGAEYPLSINNGTSELYFINSITKFGGKGMVSRSSGAGSVIAYSYFDDEFYAESAGCVANTWIDNSANDSHYTGAHHMLFEGNWAVNLDSERTHGNSMYVAFYRNFSGGYRSPFTDPSNSQSVDDLTNTPGGNGPFRAAGPQAYCYWYVFDGNVLGTPGHSTSANGWVYQATYTGAHGTGIWYGPGWYDSVGAGYNDPNLSALSSSSYITVHANYDTVNASIIYNPSYPNHTLPNSWYTSTQPSFFGSSGATCSYAWPWITPQSGTQIQVPTGGGSCSSYSGLPAKARMDAGTPFVQP